MKYSKKGRGAFDNKTGIVNKGNMQWLDEQVNGPEKARQNWFLRQGNKLNEQLNIYVKTQDQNLLHSVNTIKENVIKTLNNLSSNQDKIKHLNILFAAINLKCPLDCNDVVFFKIQKTFLAHEAYGLESPIAKKLQYNPSKHTYYTSSSSSRIRSRRRTHRTKTRGRTYRSSYYSPIRTRTKTRGRTYRSSYYSPIRTRTRRRTRTGILKKDADKIIRKAKEELRKKQKKRLKQIQRHETEKREKVLKKLKKMRSKKGGGFWSSIFGKKDATAIKTNLTNTRAQLQPKTPTVYIPKNKPYLIFSHNNRIQSVLDPVLKQAGYPDLHKVRFSNGAAIRLDFFLEAEIIKVKLSLIYEGDPESNKNFKPYWSSYNKSQEYPERVHFTPLIINLLQNGFPVIKLDQDVIELIKNRRELSFIIVRHAEAQHNVKAGRLTKAINSTFNSNTSLTEKGIEQAKGCGRALAFAANVNIDLSYIFVSDLYRTAQTCAEVLNYYITYHAAETSRDSIQIYLLPCNHEITDFAAENYTTCDLNNPNSVCKSITLTINGEPLRIDVNTVFYQLFYEGSSRYEYFYQKDSEKSCKTTSFINEAIKIISPSHYEKMFDNYIKQCSRSRFGIGNCNKKFINYFKEKYRDANEVTERYTTNNARDSMVYSDIDKEEEVTLDNHDEDEDFLQNLHDDATNTDYSASIQDPINSVPLSVPEPVPEPIHLPNPDLKRQEAYKVAVNPSYDRTQPGWTPPKQETKKPWYKFWGGKTKKRLRTRR
jgi:hypothetical protein